jgi:2-hydroxychromene-2-carboxylate isomerase
MAKQFKEQGGAATMDPSAAFRWLSSKVMTEVISPQRLDNRRHKIERQRRAKGTKYVVEYFHQLDDGYSYLAAQLLHSLGQRYDIELRCYLVTGPSGNNSVEPELLTQLAQYDTGFIAPHYGLQSPGDGPVPGAEALDQAQSILTAIMGNSSISEHLPQLLNSVSAALWSADGKALVHLAEQYGAASAEQTAQCIDLGNTRRAELKHYSGAMFYCAQEWYWGVDRLHYLEARLAQAGADKRPGQPLLAPRFEVEPGARRDHGSLTLEIYPSLRSPYTAVVFDQALELAKTTGVNLVVRPVLPMVMRGVPATREKGMYIFADAAREARSAGVPFGKFYDPIGNPVRNCYSLYPWACEQGRGNQLISSFLSCAFAGGINTNNARGLQKVVEKAGLDWSVAETLVAQPGWEEILERNRLAMYNAGLWGVPSFRLLDRQGETQLALWGQDRLWLVAREIERQLTLDSAS